MKKSAEPIVFNLRICSSTYDKVSLLLSLLVFTYYIRVYGATVEYFIKCKL